MNASSVVGTARQVEEFLSDLSRVDLQPLWTRKGLLTATPNRLSPHLWRWADVRPLAVRSGQLIDIDRGGDRRVIALSHPDLGGLPFATHTLWGGIQYLNGREFAPPHRHSPGALRFVLEGTGVWTLVNEDPIPMHPGDLVLTPSQNWHAHRNMSDEPMIWFDGLDLPLVRNLDAIFYEDGDEMLPSEAILGDRTRSEALFASPGLLPVDPGTANGSGARAASPLVLYRWAETDARLDSILTTAGKESAAVRFTNPETGRDVMPTLRAEMHRVAPSGRMLRERTVGSAMVVVFRGSGHAEIDDHEFDWETGDVFVVPSWTQMTTRSAAGADLFLLSDGPVIEALNLEHTS